MTATTRTAQWRLRTRTGQELTITAGEAHGANGASHPADAGSDADGHDDAIPYPLVFLPSDLEAWMTGPDPWARQALVEMCEEIDGGTGDGGAGNGAALAHGTPDAALPALVIPALLDAFERGDLRARVRAPRWEFPRERIREPEPADTGDAGEDEAVAREPRRISVRLGDLDAVFEPVASVHGKKQRLQALGHYYERFTASTGSQETDAYRNCLAYWRDKRERARGRPFADDAAFESDMQAEVRRFIVAGGTLPAPGAEVKIRLPGAVTCEGMAELAAVGVSDGQGLPPVRFNREQAMWDGNGALGKIPIIVKIEVRRGGTWLPANGETVHFQLIPPFHDDPTAELADIKALRDTSQRPPLRGWPGGPPERAGPRQFITGATRHAFDEHDPQRYNAHASRGGKRGLALLGNIFDGLPKNAFPDMTDPEASGTTHLHAVSVRTNASGEGGVLLLPARTAGDRYRMRIFLDPNDRVPSDGTEHDAVRFETGRLCVWRHILWSTYLFKRAPQFPEATTVSGVQARLALLGYDVGEIDGLPGTRTSEAIRAFQRAHHPLPQDGDWNHAPTQESIDLTVRDYLNGGDSYPGFGPAIPAPRFVTMAGELRGMYCELEVEPAISDLGGPPQLTPERYREALRWALWQIELAPPSELSAPRDVRAMFSDDYETPFLFEIRQPRHYNRLRAAGFPPASAAKDYSAYWNDAANILDDSDRGLIRLFLLYIATGASTARPPRRGMTGYCSPGLVIVSALALSRFSGPPNEPGQAKVPTIAHVRMLGTTYWDRACAAFGGVKIHSRQYYRDDSFTKNMMHEIGHALTLRHQIFGPPWLHPLSCREDHDMSSAVLDPTLCPAPVSYDRCVMAYAPSEGAFCGKCHLKLRGWDISRMPT